MRIMRIMRINNVMKFLEIERIIKNDGWRFKSSSGSHYHYVHAVKPGKVTIPFKRGDLHIKTISSILKQARIK